MKDFVLLQPASVPEATALAARHGAASRYYAGGQDMLYRLKRRLADSPRYLIDLKAIPGLDSITLDQDALRIGALARLSALDQSQAVRSLFPLLADAARSIASPQIRNAGTVAGNLGQDLWCWYLLEDFDCHLNGGKSCPAAAGEVTSYHAAVAQKRCVAVHPSDLAPALLALQASVTTSGPGGGRSLAIDEFLPGLTRSRGDYRVNGLRDGEMITGIVVPRPRPGTRQAFGKNRFRQSWDFATASAAAALEIEAGACRSARVVAGGVAIRPWRALETERRLTGRRLDRAACAEAADALFEGARLLKLGSYKAAVAREVVRTTLESLLPS